MKFSRTNPELARCRKHPLLIDQPLAIERVEDQRHEARGVKQRARHVARVSALSRLSRNRKLEGRIEKMLGNHRPPEYRRVYGDLPLELSQPCARIVERYAAADLTGIDLAMKAHRVP